MSLYHVTQRGSVVHHHTRCSQSLSKDRHPFVPFAGVDEIQHPKFDQLLKTTIHFYVCTHAHSHICTLRLLLTFSEIEFESSLFSIYLNTPLDKTLKRGGRWVAVWLVTIRVLCFLTLIQSDGKIMQYLSCSLFQYSFSLILERVASQSNP